MQEVKKPPSGSGTESGEKTASNWKWYDIMDEAIGGKPSITPPILIATSWEESPPRSDSRSTSQASPDSVPPGSTSVTTSDHTSPDPVPAKKRRDGVLEFLERAEEREEERSKREEAREERMLSLLEKMAEKY